MLILENIHLIAAKKSFLNATKKYLRISIGKNVSCTREAAKVKSQTELQWSESVSLPLAIGQSYAFEIFEKHDFGYNPEELGGLLSGKLIISENDTFNNFQVFTQKRQKFGFLSASIRKRVQYSPSTSTAPAQPQILTIASLIAHLPSLKQKRAYLVVKVGKNTSKTQITKNKDGELLFTDPIEIEKTDDDIQGIVEAFSYDAKEEKSELIGSGKFMMNAQKQDKRVNLRNQKGPVGQVFIDHKVVQKNLYNSSKILTRIVQKGNSLSRIIEQKESFLTGSFISKTINKTFQQQLQRSSRCSSGKKISVVHKNTNIFMPTQKRFMNYQDTKNDRISYLQSRDDFDFKEKQSKNYYKGASIGKDNKYDFTQVLKDNPGVGGYHIPTIWDRY